MTVAFRLTPIQRKILADKLLAWLKVKDISTVFSTSTLLDHASEELSEQKFHLWRAFELLRIMGRVELNSPNGRKGFHVLDYTSLSVYQLRTDNFKVGVETDMLVQILKDLRKRYGKIWNNAMWEAFEKDGE